MNEEKWSEIQNKIKEEYQVLDQGKEAGEVEGEEIEYIEWEAGDKQMRAQYHHKPKLLDKKTHYSRRIGSEVTEEAVYSQEEKVTFVRFYSRQQSTDDWQEISLHNFT